MNIVMIFSCFGMCLVLLIFIGCDVEGEEFLQVCKEFGMGIDFVYFLDDLLIDSYMVVEGVNGLIVVIVDVYFLEVVGDKIFCLLMDGIFGSDEVLYDGYIVLDGNLI